MKTQSNNKPDIHAAGASTPPDGWLSYDTKPIENKVYRFELVEAKGSSNISNLPTEIDGVPVEMFMSLNTFRKIMHMNKICSDALIRMGVVQAYEEQGKIAISLRAWLAFFDWLRSVNGCPNWLNR